MNAIENEYKFVNHNTSGYNYYYNLLTNYLNEKGVKYSVSKSDYSDTFYDTENLYMSSKGCFLRNRNKLNGGGVLTIKKPISSKGMLSREEIEEPYTGTCTYDMLSDFCRRNMGDLVLSEKFLFVMITNRTSFKFDSDTRLKLTLDDCRYYDGPYKLDFLEIELEIVSDREEKEFDIAGIREFITEKMDFAPVKESKFSRGLKWKQTLPEHDTY